MPTPPRSYIVLPENTTSSYNAVTTNIFSDLDAAKRSCVSMSLSTGHRHIIYTATSYAETTLDATTVAALVQAIA